MERAFRAVGANRQPRSVGECALKRGRIRRRDLRCSYIVAGDASRIASCVNIRPTAQRQLNRRIAHRGNSRIAWFTGRLSRLILIRALGTRGARAGRAGIVRVAPGRARETRRLPVDDVEFASRAQKAAVLPFVRLVAASWAVAAFRRCDAAAFRARLTLGASALTRQSNKRATVQAGELAQSDA